MISFLLFLACGFWYFRTTGSFPIPTIVKYPPRLFFLSYSVALSFILLIITEDKSCWLFKSWIVRFVSAHSLWIYLWHIFYLWIVQKLVPEAGRDIWFCMVTAFSIVTGWIQNRILDAASLNGYKWKWLRG